jgi:hypothetical protein
MTEEGKPRVDSFGLPVLVAVDTQVGGRGCLLAAALLMAGGCCWSAGGLVGRCDTKGGWGRQADVQTCCMCMACVHTAQHHPQVHSTSISMHDGCLQGAVMAMHLHIYAMHAGCLQGAMMAMHPDGCIVMGMDGTPAAVLTTADGHLLLDQHNRCLGSEGSMWAGGEGAGIHVLQSCASGLLASPVPHPPSKQHSAARPPARLRPGSASHPCPPVPCPPHLPLLPSPAGSWPMHAWRPAGRWWWRTSPPACPLVRELLVPCCILTTACRSSLRWPATETCCPCASTAAR